MIQQLNHHLAEAARIRGMQLESARRHPQIEAIRTQVRLPFEYRAAKVAAEIMSSKIFLVDQSAFSRRMIAHWYELISARNIENLLATAIEAPSIQSMYRKASLGIADSSSFGLTGLKEADTEEEIIWLERETFMAFKIMSILAAFKNKTAVYVGGWRHLTVGGNIPSLRDLLGVSSTQCLLINQER
jgi:hypothetical protein